MDSSLSCSACEATEETIYAREFRRDIEESIADAVAIEPSGRLVVVEGNYLLIPARPWCRLRALLDEIWYCERDEDARVADLIARHRAYGKSEDEARRWALGPDQRNAELIHATKGRADRIVSVGTRAVAETGPAPTTRLLLTDESRSS